MIKTKKVISVFIALVLLFCSIQIGMVVTAESGGWIEVYTFEDLYDVRYNLSANYRLMNDIDMTEWVKSGGDYDFYGQGWNPIGSNDIYSNDTFSGCFDGNGYTVSGLRIDAKSFPSGTKGVCLGLFSDVSGTIRNLSVEGSITLNHYYNNNYVGGITAISSGLIEKCKSNVRLNVVTSSKESYIGGIAGYNTGTINKSCNNALIEATFQTNISTYTGIIYMSGIANCGKNDRISGDVYYGKVFSCFNNKKVKVVDKKDDNLQINTHFVSGIANHVKEAKNCYNTGEVTSNNQHNAGIAYAAKLIQNCYNIGMITNGYNNLNCAITYDGYISEVTNCYYLSGSGITSRGSTECSAAQLKRQITFVEWDFNDIWTMEGDNNYYYPELQDVGPTIPEANRIPIAGELRLIGKCEVNSRLSADISNVTPSNATLAFCWSLDNQEISVEPSYLIGISDVGKELKLTVTGVGYFKGSLSTSCVPSEEHQHVEETLPAVPATCTKAGLTEGKVCSECSEILVEQIEIPALGHTSQTYTTPSTCAENGFTVSYCTRCGETLSHEILPRLEHTWNDGEVTAEPTCTALGVKTFTCESCGATYTEPVDLLAHDWDDGVVTKEPSCTEAGEMTYTCATGGETRTEPIDKLDHKIVLVPGKAATCEEPGLTDGWQCETCQKWFAEQQPIEPTGHDMQIQAYVAPTCEEGGYAPFVCSRCGYTEKTDPEPALGHDYQPIYEWSADNSTVTASLICTRCDDVQAKETVNTACKTVEATCMNPGLLTYTSEGFANKAFYVQTKTIEIAQKPHMTTQIREVSPTCDREGVGSYWTCSTCDGIFEDEAATRPLEEPPVLPKLPHTPGEPVTENETAATCTAEGSYDTVVYCFACGQELSRETIPTEKTPHADADNDGHCDACGAQMQGGDHCKVCGKIHNGGFFDKLTGFFHRIIGIFKR